MLICHDLFNGGTHRHSWRDRVQTAITLNWAPLRTHVACNSLILNVWVLQVSGHGIWCTEHVVVTAIPSPYLLCLSMAASNHPQKTYIKTYTL